MTANPLPHILIIDDVFGRTLPDHRNEDRANLCGQYLLQDVTGDEIDKDNPLRIRKPIAQAVFCRGLKPVCSKVGDLVERDIEGTIEIIRKGWDDEDTDALLWSLVLLDLCFYTGRVTLESTRSKGEGMPEGREEDNHPRKYLGLQILDAIHQKFPDLPVIILSSKPREEIAREFSIRGALGFLPREDENSPQKLQELIVRHGLIPDPSGQTVGNSKALLIALRAARRASETQGNILLRGETGTGKELFAHYIHNYRKKENHSPFITVNSPALTSTLWESELFGIRRRVATNVDERLGKIRAANDGDIFFDEIGDMLLETQAGILRVLEYKEVTPVGSEVSYPVNVRFLSATNIDIEAKSATGSFRSDLLYRLNQGGTVILPPLRGRMTDVPLLIERFVREAESKNPFALERQVEPGVIERVLGYDWPGNIRQLESVITSAVNTNPDVEFLVPGHLTIPDTAREKTAIAISPVSGSSNSVNRTSTLRGKDLDLFIEELENHEFSVYEIEKLAGKLPGIQRAFAKFIARYLKTILLGTKKISPANPNGEIKYTSAIKFMNGDPKISTSAAADIIKKLLSLDSQSMEEILEDQLLREVYEKARGLRPNNPKSRKIDENKSSDS